MTYGEKRLLFQLTAYAFADYFRDIGLGDMTPDQYRDFEALRDHRRVPWVGQDVSALDRFARVCSDAGIMGEDYFDARHLIFLGAPERPEIHATTPREETP